MTTSRKMGKGLWFLPDKGWQMTALIGVAVLFGLGIYGAYFSHLPSYLSDDPKACINCHVMTSYYSSWKNSSHREVATCNDCHVPHNNIVSKYYFKAKDGLYHSYVFTTHTEPQVIRAKAASIEVIHDNCVRCHLKNVVDSKMLGVVEGHSGNRTERLCWDCHAGVPHSRIRGASSIDFQIEATQFDEQSGERLIPEWIKKEINKNKDKK